MGMVDGCHRGRSGEGRVKGVIICLGPGVASCLKALDHVQIFWGSSVPDGPSTGVPCALYYRR